VTSAYAPPVIGGTPSVMYECLRHFPSGSFVLVTVDMPVASKDTRVLFAKTLLLPEDSRIRALRFIWLPLVLAKRILLTLLFLRNQSVRPRNILAVYPSLDFIMMSLILSKLLDLPLFVYFHDCLVETMSHEQRFFGRFVERAVFRESKKVYALSEPMRAFYVRKGYSMDVLPHGLDPGLVRNPSSSNRSGTFSIGFAGAVYATNDKGILDLLSAKKLARDKPTIRIATTKSSMDYLSSLGAVKDVDVMTTLRTHDELIDFLAGCDVLFLPMNFESVYHDDLTTIFPTKVTDYWLAQRPVLAYGPDEYAFIRYASEQGFALTVTKKGPENIVRALEELRASPALISSLTACSKKMISIHDGAEVSSKLWADLNNS
jgi:hypothetical protein